MHPVIHTALVALAAYAACALLQRSGFAIPIVGDLLPK